MKSNNNLNICQSCLNKRFNSEKELICGRTNKKTDFNGECSFHESNRKEDEENTITNKVGKLEKNDRFRLLAILVSLSVGIYLFAGKAYKGDNDSAYAYLSAGIFFSFAALSTLQNPKIKKILTLSLCPLIILFYALPIVAILTQGPDNELAIISAMSCSIIFMSVVLLIKSLKKKKADVALKKTPKPFNC